MKKQGKKGIIIGIAGGTGSGKTLVAETILNDLGSDDVIIIQQDSYYRDLGPMPFESRVKQNFDHPDAFDAPLFTAQVKDLLKGKKIEQPVYDFKNHIRTKKTKTLGPHNILILEGILILYYPELRELMDIKVFVDTDPDIRFIRRLLRDIKTRGRTMDSVIQQYVATVRPMHLEFVEPSKRFADIIIPEGGYNRVAIDLLKTKIRSLFTDHTPHLKHRENQHGIHESL